MDNEISKTGWEIAVIGLSCRFPGAKHINEFWENLKNGVESISFYSEQELIDSGVDPGLIKNPNYIKAYGFLSDTEYFDSHFFDYTPKEAESMDPQMRIFHECAWQALEDAGYNTEAYRGMIGLYAGASPNWHWEALSMFSGKMDEMGYFAASQLYDKDYLGLRISFKLNLRGPSFTMYTACSTSLVAIHLACQALLNGECDMALAGGVTVSRLNKMGYFYSEGMISSPEGHCRTFDAKGNGFVGGDGVGIVVLKRFETAATDGDHIYSVIKGSAINNDGERKVGFTAPSVEGQAEVIRISQQMAEVEPETIGYIEAHGTATALGDPVEIEALNLAFNTERKGYSGIGSVKTNIGHLDSAAGAAGFIKTVLALHHRLIPPSLHFESANPKIDLENSPFYVVNQLSPWNNSKYPLRAGVSSFGIGGTNAHVVLEEAPKKKDSSGTRKWHLVLLSAKTGSALDIMTDNFVKFLKNNPGIHMADAAYTLGVGRKGWRHRRMAVCSSRDDAINTLSTHHSPGNHSFLSRENNPPLIFMFPGQGSQYINMGLELYQKEPVFRETMDRCFEILTAFTANSIKDILYPPPESPVSASSKHQPDAEFSNPSPAANPGKINHTEIAQPVIFIIAYCLAKLLMKWGITPYAMIGHSIGEYVAACLSGVFSLEDAIRLIALRGKLMQSMPGGAMLSVPLSENDLIPLLNEEIALAAVNGPSRCVVSGTYQAIELFEKQLQEKGYKSTHLHTSHAFHSKMMEPIMAEFHENVTPLQLNRPQIPYISNVSGDWITVDQAASPRYWTNHLRAPVRFSDGLEELLKKENAIFLELGPGKTLSTFVNQHNNKKSNQSVLNLLRHPQEKISDVYFLLTKLGQLWLYGGKIDWEEFYSPGKRCRVPLPTYPFEGHRYLLETGATRINAGAGMMLKSSKINKKPDIADWFYTPSWKRDKLTLTHHESKEQINRLNMLIFMNEGDFPRQLAQYLERQCPHITMVTPAREFAKNGENQYQINPQKSHDYVALLGELQKSGHMPNRIIHLWGVTGYESGNWQLEGIRKTLDMGFYSLLYTAQALGKLKITVETGIKVVTNNMQEIIGKELLFPEKATVLGAVKVIPLEYPNISCSSIDIDLCNSNSWQEELLKQLLVELTAATSDQVIAYRGKHRWVQTFTPTPLEKSNHVPPLLRKRGVYLITGGVGGIGLSLARYLSESVQARLILTGRSTFPARDSWEKWLDTHEKNDSTSDKIKEIKKIEALGGEVLVLSADVANEEKMQHVMTRVKKQYSQINGVIHAAGLADRGVIQQRTREMTEEVLSPKVTGTIVLDRLVKNVQLDFFVICSSLNSFLPSIGQIGYCAANAFLDAYAYHKASCEDIPIASINWGGWQEVGMAARARAARSADKSQYGILTSEGIEAFCRIINEPMPQVAVSPGDLFMLLEQVKAFEAGDSSAIESVIDAVPPENTLQRPELTTKYAAPKDELEKKLVQIWQKYFGFETIGIYDDFFELGGDSLKGMMFINSYKELLGEIVHITAIYDAPNIAELTAYFKEQYPDAVKKILHSKITRDISPEAGRITTAALENIRQRITAPLPLPGMKSAKNPPAIFILTAPRSGSTLFRVILGGHPQLFAPPEMKLISINTLDETFLDNEGALRAVMEIKHCNLDQSTEIIQNLIKQQITSKEFYRLLQEWIGDKILVDKTPQYTLHPDTLKRIEDFFQEPYYLHLLRHPYGMIRSFEEAKLDLFGGRHILKELSISRRELAEAIWDISNQNILQFLDLIPAHRKYRVIFEDLVLSPQTTVEGICRFLNIEFHPGMLEPYKEKKQRMTDGIHAQGLMVGDIKFHQHKRIDTDAADNWKKYYTVDFMGDITRQLSKSFGYKTIKEITTSVHATPEPVEEKEHYELSYNQKRLWLIQQVEPESPAYNMNRRIVLPHRVEKNLLKEVFHRIVKHHESFRTGFRLVDGHPVQFVKKEVTIPFREIDISSLSREEKQRKRELIFSQEISTPFKLTDCPLFRALLIKLAVDQYELIFTMHHIVTDVWSMEIVKNDFSLIYEGLIKGEDPGLKLLKLQFKDFVQWQNKRFHDPVIKEKSHQFWLNKLKAGFPPLKLPVDYNENEAYRNRKGAAYRSVIQMNLKENLNKFAKNNSTSLFAVMFAAVNIILSHFSNQNDIVCAIAAAGREHTHLHDIVGFFVNTILVKNVMNPEEDFIDFLHRVNRNVLDTLQHQSYPLDQVLDDLNMKFPPMNVFFNMTSMRKDEYDDELVSLQPYHQERAQDSRFDITFYVREYKNGMVLNLHYKKSLFKPITIESIANAYWQLLEEISQSQEKSNENE